MNDEEEVDGICRWLSLARGWSVVAVLRSGGRVGRIRVLLYQITTYT
jgi:hypothetical protein